MTDTVEDQTVEFLLRRDPSIEPPELKSLLTAEPYELRHWRDGFDEEQKELRESIWELKSKLDCIDDKEYTNLRNQLFPLAVSGQQSRLFFNRAGFKLMETMEATGVWLIMKKFAISSEGKNKKRKKKAVSFVDVCGGPGAFSQALFALGRKHEMKLKGFGLTLGEVEGLDWYPQLLKKDFTPTYGVDGTGDVFKLANLNALRSITEGEQVLLVVADGGFTVSFDVANYQETISARITYGQWLAALKLLQPGGCFVLKLFDTFSPNTRAFLYLSTFIFKSVHIVKPRHSRVVNSERYLACLNFIGVSTDWMDYLEDYYDRGFKDNDHSPQLIPPQWMDRDALFMSDMRGMNTKVGANQRTALRMIIRAYEEGKASVPSKNEEEEEKVEEDSRKRSREEVEQETEE